MAKNFGRKPRDTEKVQGFAQRRGGANYQDAYRASKSRLKQLAKDFEDTPISYRGFLLVGVCTAMESHLKYFYAHATDRYASHPEVLLRLLKDVSVDVETIISISTSTFQLSDVVAATISASTLDGYLGKCSDFISVINGQEHKFPWSYQEIMTEGDPQWKKDIAEKLKRLRIVFEARHRLVHETDVLDHVGDNALAGLDGNQVIQDALWLMGEFEKIYWDSEFNPDINIKKRDAGLEETVNAAEADLDAVFARIAGDLEERQIDLGVKFQEAFRDYLWARSEFMASAFVAQRSEEAMGFFVDLVAQYLPVLNRVYLEQHFLRAKYPTARQELDLLHPNFGEDDTVHNEDQSGTTDGL